MKLYYANNDRRVEHKSVDYNLYNLKKKTEEVSAEAISAIGIPRFFLLTHCFGNAMPKRNLFPIYGTRSLRVSFFLIVFSNRFPVWLMKPEVNWQGNCDQVICITQLDTLNYWSWFVIRLTVSMMRNAASICLSRLRKVPRSCTTKMNDGSNVIMKIMQENICRVRSRNEIEAWNVSEDCEALPKKRNAMLLRG